MSDQAILTVGNFNYALGKMDAITQFHVSRRLSPLLASLIPIMQELRPAKKEDPSGLAVPSAKSLLDIPMEKIITLASTFSELPDEPLNYVLGKCLTVVKRDMGNGLGYTPVWNAAAQTPNFADLQFPELLRLVSAVVWFNFQGFISAADMLGAQDAAMKSP